MTVKPSGNAKRNCRTVFFTVHESVNIYGETKYFHKKGGRPKKRAVSYIFIFNQKAIRRRARTP